MCSHTHLLPFQSCLPCYRSPSFSLKTTWLPACWVCELTVCFAMCFWMRRVRSYRRCLRSLTLPRNQAWWQHRPVTQVWGCRRGLWRTPCLRRKHTIIILQVSQVQLQPWALTDRCCKTKCEHSKSDQCHPFRSVCVCVCVLLIRPPPFKTIFKNVAWLIIFMFCCERLMTESLCPLTTCSDDQ